MTNSENPSPSRGWWVVAAGLAVNLCLGILYAWSVWKAELVASKAKGTEVGAEMRGLNAGWRYLSDADATLAYSLCGLTFALCMIPGGWVQDRYGPRTGATLGGLCLAAGCILTGLMQSYTGLLVGFGLLGGIGMGFGYAAATPAAVRWFGPHRRGLIVGIVVAGYGGAAIYISPLAEYLISTQGISGSFIALGIFFAVVVVGAGFVLRLPPAGYSPPAPPAEWSRPTMTSRSWSPGEMLGTWQFFALVFLFFVSAQSGLLVIANAKLIGGGLGSWAWMLASLGGFVNAAGRIGTGVYSDRIGRLNAFALNGLVSAVCLALTPWVLASGSVPLLLLVAGVAYWQYGGGLALLPALTADFFGAKNMGVNYGLVFLGWGLAFLVPQLAGFIKDATGSLDLAFYLSSGLLVAGVLLSRAMRRPMHADESR